jgi:DNA-binding transcriptional LysR family regulator
MKLSLDALAILDAIDAAGSFAAAAQRLHRVPSALTHAIRKLEEDLGYPIYERVGRRASLTAAGRTLLEEGRRLLGAAQALECRARRVATGWEADLRIGVDGLIPVTAVLPLVDAFYREASGTRLRLIPEILGGCWDALVSGRADLMIGAPGDAPAHSNLSTRQLGEVDFAFCVAPGHPLASAPEPISASAITTHRLVVVADSSRLLAPRSTGLSDGQDVLTVGDMEAKLAAQVAGLGVGFLPLGMATRAAAEGRLVIRQCALPRPRVLLHLAWPTDHDGRALRWFVKRLAEPEWRARLLGERGEG